MSQLIAFYNDWATTACNIELRILALQGSRWTQVEIAPDVIIHTFQINHSVTNELCHPGFNYEYSIAIIFEFKTVRTLIFAFF